MRNLKAEVDPVVFIFFSDKVARDGSVVGDQRGPGGDRRTHRRQFPCIIVRILINLVVFFPPQDAVSLCCFFFVECVVCLFRAGMDFRSWRRLRIRVGRAGSWKSSQRKCETVNGNFSLSLIVLIKEPVFNTFKRLIDRLIEFDAVVVLKHTEF